MNGTFFITLISLILLIYDYSKNDLLNTPNRYQMTPYHGVSFLKSFLESRQKFLTSNSSDIKNANFDSLLSNIILDLNNIETHYFTNDLFSEILKKITKNDFNSNVVSFINTFVKKFEIKKKIFDEYDYANKEISSNFSLLKNYVLFALICRFSFEHFSNLKYLNTLLKLNDLLCSQWNNLTKSEQLIVQHSITFEINTIKEISLKKGVKIH